MSIFGGANQISGCKKSIKCDSLGMNHCSRQKRLEYFNRKLLQKIELSADEWDHSIHEHYCCVF